MIPKISSSFTALLPCPPCSSLSFTQHLFAYQTPHVLFFISYRHPEHLRPLLLSSSSRLSVSPQVSVFQSLPHPIALLPSASGLVADGCQSVPLLPPAHSGSVPMWRSSTCSQHSHWERKSKGFPCVINLTFMQLHWLVCGIVLCCEAEETSAYGRGYFFHSSLGDNVW